MPVATVDPNKFKRFELKTALGDPNDPTDENGWIELRPLPFGRVLDRQDETMEMQMKARRPQDRKRKGQDSELPDINLKSLNRKATEFDFAYCIGIHNLTDVNKEPLDLTNPIVFNVLDPRIAQEISSLIDGLNNPDDEEGAEDFIKRVTSLHGETTEPQTALMTEVSNTATP